MAGAKVGATTPRRQTAIVAQTNAVAGRTVVKAEPKLWPFMNQAASAFGDKVSAPGAIRHDIAHQVADVVFQISDDVLDDVSDRDHADDLARVQHR